MPKSAVTVSGSEHLAWYRSSEKVRRGFCARCGSWLFWEPLQHDWTSAALGAIDGPTGLALERHIFVADKGDYYEIGDGLPLSEHQNRLLSHGFVGTNDSELAPPSTGR